MTPKSFDLLVYLIRHRERVIGIDELQRQLWSAQPASSGAIARTVMLVRKAIEDNARAPRSIRTLYRSGFRFIAPVRFSDQEPTGSAAAQNSAPLESPQTIERIERGLVVPVVPIVAHLQEVNMSWTTHALTLKACDLLSEDRGVLVTLRPPLVVQANTAIGEHLLTQRMENERTRIDATCFVFVRWLEVPPDLSVWLKVYRSGRVAFLGTIHGRNALDLTRLLADKIAFELPHWK